MFCGRQYLQRASLCSSYSNSYTARPACPHCNGVLGAGLEYGRFWKISVYWHRRKRILWSSCKMHGQVMNSFIMSCDHSHDSLNIYKIRHYWIGRNQEDRCFFWRADQREKSTKRNSDPASIESSKYYCIEGLLLSNVESNKRKFKLLGQCIPSFWMRWYRPCKDNQVESIFIRRPYSIYNVSASLWIGVPSCDKCYSSRFETS